MNKKRLTLLLDDKQIRIIKSRAALAGMSGSQWVIAQLDLETTQGDTSTPAAQAPAKPRQKPVTPAAKVQPDAALVDLVPDYTGGKKMPKDERDALLLKLDAITDDTPEAAQGVVDLLTKNAIPTDTRKNCYRVEWTYKKFRDLVNKIKNREKNR